MHIYIETFKALLLVKYTLTIGAKDKSGKMEEKRKRGREEEGDTVSFPEVEGFREEGTTEGSGDLGEDIMELLSIEGDTVSELMSLLLDTTTDDNGETVSKVKFIDNPYSSPLIFQASSSYVTINGNEESCGSSFSDLESSVMASVDKGGIPSVSREWEPSAAATTAWGLDEAENGAGWYLAGIGEMDGCDGSDLDDNVLARFLGEESLCLNDE